MSNILSIAHADNQLEETKALAAIVSSRSTFAEDRRVNGGSRLAIVPSTSNLAYLVLVYLAVKVLYLVNGALCFPALPEREIEANRESTNEQFNKLSSDS